MWHVHIFRCVIQVEIFIRSRGKGQYVALQVVVKDANEGPGALNLYSDEEIGDNNHRSAVWHHIMHQNTARRLKI